LKTSDTPGRCAQAVAGVRKLGTHLLVLGPLVSIAWLKSSRDVIRTIPLRGMEGARHYDQIGKPFVNGRVEQAADLNSQGSAPQETESCRRFLTTARERYSKDLHKGPRCAYQKGPRCGVLHAESRGPRCWEIVIIVRGRQWRLITRISSSRSTSWRTRVRRFDRCPAPTS
jgi:hypothetical protein